MTEHASGVVVACHRDEWEVAVEGRGVLRSSARGRQFLEITGGDKPIVPGDRVSIEVLDDGSGVIEGVLPRETTLSRRLPGSRQVREQVVVANAEQLVAVASLAGPRLNRRLLDRFLVIAEEAGLSSVVVLNKIDLAPEDDCRAVARAYEAAGYAVLPTCAVDGRGVSELAATLAGRFSVLTGPSGAGKSSLLNRVDPALDIRVREISQKTGKGKHTTSSVRVFSLPGGGIVADTPGFRELGLWRVRRDELDYLFPEFRPLIPQCRFRGCSHGPEPGCAVKDAVAGGTVDSERYDSYLKLLAEIGGQE